MKNVRDIDKSVIKMGLLLVFASDNKNAADEGLLYNSSREDNASKRKEALLINEVNARERDNGK